jgi:hypothetical protein
MRLQHLGARVHELIGGAVPCLLGEGLGPFGLAAAPGAVAGVQQPSRSLADRR